MLWEMEQFHAAKNVELQTALREYASLQHEFAHRMSEVWGGLTATFLTWQVWGGLTA